MKRVTVISAHPDDETLGCGATLLKHAAVGDELSWIIATDPWAPLFSSAWIDRREQQIDSVAKAYGMKNVFRLGFPTTKLDAVPLADIFTAMRSAISTTNPELVYSVFPGDAHSDHRVTFEAAYNSIKPFNTSALPDFYCYETISSTELAPPLSGRQFIPNAFSQVDDFIHQKLEMLNLYEGEIFSAPHPRSPELVESLARLRGSLAGGHFAEAFMVLRKVW